MKSQREQEIRNNLHDRLEAWRSQGVDPYPSKTTARSFRLGEIHEKQKEIGDKVITVAGRLVLLRKMGKSSFMKIEDETSELQLFFAKDGLKEAYDASKRLDRGDFLEAQGKLFVTKTGELTLEVQAFQLLSKIQAPLPEKWHGLKDSEERQRRRYLDLLTNKESRELFRRRSEFIKNMRTFLDSETFIEVQTPILQPLYGGALAKPFVTHHNTLDMDLYLRIAPELYLKRLVVGGYERVYEIASCFRNEGVSPQHLQEFYMLEFYVAYLEYQAMMDFIAKFLKETMQQTFGKLVFSYQGEELDFSKDWPQQDFRELVLGDTGIDILKHSSKEELLADINAKDLKLDIEEGASHAKIIDELYKTYSRPKIIQPTYLVNHPTVLSPLAKKSPDNPKTVERFQLVVSGFEVVNGFSEINDPEDQRARFEEQAASREAGDDEAHAIDNDYVQALEYGMPPTSGMGMGIERIFSILTDQPSVRDVVLFPTFRPKTQDDSKEK